MKNLALAGLAMLSVLLIPLAAMAHHADEAAFGLPTFEVVFDAFDHIEPAPVVAADYAESTEGVAVGATAPTFLAEWSGITSEPLAYHLAAVHSGSIWSVLPDDALSGGDGHAT